MTQRNDRETELPIDPPVFDELLAAISPMEPPATLRARVLDKVRAAGKTFVTLRGAEGEWRQISPGIDVKRLVIDEHTGSKSFLLRAAPGANLPAHPHRGLEECLVLEGEFSMGELTLRAGDFHCAAGGSEHEVATTRTGVLIYLRGNIEDYAWA